MLLAGDGAGMAREAELKHIWNTYLTLARALSILYAATVIFATMLELPVAMRRRLAVYLRSDCEAVKTTV